MVDEKLIKSVQTTFKLSGLVITRRLCALVANSLLGLDEIERQPWLTQITEQILSQDLEDHNVSLEQVKRAMVECLKPEGSLQETETVLNVLDVFKVPKVNYDLARKKFLLETVVPDLYPEASCKSAVLKDRLSLLWHRTLKHKLFAPVQFGEAAEDRLILKPIEFLLSAATTNEVCVMGLVSQLTEGQYYLEDLSGVVKVDLSKAYQSGLITEGSIVIANGEYEDGILRIDNIGFPPPEASGDSRVNFGTANTFGGSHPVSLKYSEKLKAYEESDGRMMVFISEFWVDNLVVLEKFRTMLDEYTEGPPIAFVICGHFLSFPPNLTSAQKMREGFKRLTDIVTNYPEIIESTKFIFVPGPYDLGAPKILPRAPLPKCILKDFTDKVPGTILATNPCRIQYCTKEIVVLREDMLTKLCRNTIHFSSDGQVPKDYAKSIICQAHIAPMGLPTIPVYWKHDHALQLYPSPDLVVVADQFEPYTEKFNDCHVINPGSFPKNDSPFRAYYPAQNLIEDCCIPNVTSGQS